ncbi:MAG: DUF3500 domain-containing protein [Tetrasphaera sp.]
MSSFRDHLFPLDHPRLAGLSELDAYEYADAHRTHPVAGPAIAGWLALAEAEFGGVTTDGEIIPGRFQPGPAENAPTRAAAAAAEALIAAVPDEDAERLRHPIDSAVWRAWMNPEFYLNRHGLRLEELDPSVRDLALEVVRASLSESGYAVARGVMRTNHFLGELVELPRILNEYSYNLNIFGTPSADEPWGWNLYGHHLCLNTVFVGGQQFFTPVFFGAEPNVIDKGPYAGTRLFDRHEELALAFRRGLPPAKAAAATLFDRKRDPAMPPDRLHPGDELHLGGAFQDNRVIPYEGLPLVDATAEERAAVLAIVAAYLHYIPDGPRAARLREFEAHLDETWFAWIGGTDDDSPFYYRIQSPVILVEFDHHAGIFLANPEPERFHIHTLVRTPNGNDYGAAVVAQVRGADSKLSGPA